MVCICVFACCVQICAVCNDAQIVYDAEEGTYGRIGEPTEAALSVLVEKLGVPGAFGGGEGTNSPQLARNTLTRDMLTRQRSKMQSNVRIVPDSSRRCTACAYSRLAAVKL